MTPGSGVVWARRPQSWPTECVARGDVVIAIMPTPAVGCVPDRTTVVNTSASMSGPAAAASDIADHATAVGEISDRWRGLAEHGIWVSWFCPGTHWYWQTRAYRHPGRRW